VQNVTFTKEHISTLALGLNYALEKDPKGFCTVHRYTQKQDWINMLPHDRTI